jgi:hypothetical protein
LGAKAISEYVSPIILIPGTVNKSLHLNKLIQCVWVYSSTLVGTVWGISRLDSDSRFNVRPAFPITGGAVGYSSRNKVLNDLPQAADALLGISSFSPVKPTSETPAFSFVKLCFI